MAATFTFEFLERPDEFGGARLVATARKVEGGVEKEGKTSGPSAQILLHEISKLLQRVVSFGNGNSPPPALRVFGERSDE